VRTKGLRILGAVLCLCHFSGCSWALDRHSNFWLGRPLSDQAGRIIASRYSATQISQIDQCRFSRIYDSLLREHLLTDTSASLRHPSHILRQAKARVSPLYVELCRRQEGDQLYIHIWSRWPHGYYSKMRAIEANLERKLANEFGPATERAQSP
jgi:hypothetical protein